MPKEKENSQEFKGEDMSVFEFLGKLLSKITRLKYSCNTYLMF